MNPGCREEWPRSTPCRRTPVPPTWWGQKYQAVRACGNILARASARETAAARLRWRAVQGVFRLSLGVEVAPPSCRSLSVHALPPTGTARATLETSPQVDARRCVASTTDATAPMVREIECCARPPSRWEAAFSSSGFRAAARVGLRMSLGVSFNGRLVYGDLLRFRPYKERLAESYSLASQPAVPSQSQDESSTPRARY